MQTVIYTHTLSVHHHHYHHTSSMLTHHPSPPSPPLSNPPPHYHISPSLSSPPPPPPPSPPPHLLYACVLSQWCEVNLGEASWRLFPSLNDSYDVFLGVVMSVPPMTHTLVHLQLPDVHLRNTWGKDAGVYFIFIFIYLNFFFPFIGYR